MSTSLENIPGSDLSIFILKSIDNFIIEYFPEHKNILNIIKTVNFYLNLNYTMSEKIGNYFKNNIISKSDETYEHTKLIESDWICKYIKLDGRYKFTKEQIAFLAHWHHATINNITLTNIVFESTIHSFKPGQYPNDSYKKLALLFYIARQHQTKEVSNSVIDYVFKFFREKIKIPVWKEKFYNITKFEQKKIKEEFTDEHFIKFLHSNIKTKTNEIDH